MTHATLRTYIYVNTTILLKIALHLSINKLMNKKTRCILNGNWKVNILGACKAVQNKKSNEKLLVWAVSSSLQIKVSIFGWIHIHICSSAISYAVITRCPTKCVHTHSINLPVAVSNVLFKLILDVYGSVFKLRCS